MTIGSDSNNYQTFSSQGKDSYFDQTHLDLNVLAMHQDTTTMNQVRL